MTNQDRLVVAEIAAKWIKTPFYPHMAKRGVGADCVQMALEIYKEAGLLPREVDLPIYRLDSGDHIDSNQVTRWLETSGFMRRVVAMAAGSLVVLKVGRVEHHVGVAVSSFKFVQAIRRYGVVESDLRDSTWAERVRSYWEPL